MRSASQRTIRRTISSSSTRVTTALRPTVDSTARALSSARLSQPIREMTSSSAANFFGRRTPATAGGAGAGAAAMHSAVAAPRASPGRLAQIFSPGSSTWASSDLRAYHDRYPGQRQHAGSNKNLLFYTNQIASVPSGAKIDVIHATWFGQHDLLEAHHGYIQWIFPIREDGMNSQSQMLMLHEIAALKQDPAFPKRLLSSYRLMLDFYGLTLADPVTGRVVRGANYRSRYQHLNRSTHNYLRITRILKCLGELGMEHLKLGFLLLIVRELTVGELKPASVGRSAVNYWFPTLRSPADRARLQSVIDELVAAEAAAPEGKEIALSERRIAQVLEEAMEARTHKNGGAVAAADDAEEDEDVDVDEGAAAAASSNGTKAGSSAAAAGPSSSVGFVSDSDGEGEGEDAEEDWDTDSPRAGAESMAVSRAASSETEKGQTVAAAPVAAAVASSSAASAASPSAASAPAPALLSKRKSVDGTDDADGGMVDDSPRAKKAPTPTAAGAAANGANGHAAANGKAQ